MEKECLCAGSCLSHAQGNFIAKAGLYRELKGSEAVNRACISMNSTHGIGLACSLFSCASQGELAKVARIE